MTYPEQEIARCKAAMELPAPLAALRQLASGRMVVELEGKERDVVIDTIDGRPVRDAEGRKMGMSGAWPLFRAGMIDEFGVVTEAGHAHLAAKSA